MGILKRSLSIAFSILFTIIATILLTGCWFTDNDNNNDDKDKTPSICDNITEEYLNSFGSYDDLPKSFTGHSRPVDIRPTEGVRITAPANAFNHDTEVKMTGLDEKSYDKLNDQCEKVGLDMLLAYDIDAGLAANEVMPGTYKVEFDLAALGIPEALWDDLRCYRMTDDGVITEYSTRVKSGKLVYESAMNTKAFIAKAMKGLGKWAWKSLSTPKYYLQGVIITPFLYAIGTIVLRQFILAPFKQYPMESTYVVSVEDEYGDFNVIYNQRFCENGSSTSAFDEKGRSKDELVEKRLNELYGEAQILINKKVEEAGKAGNAGWFQSKRQREAMQKKLKHHVVYDSLCRNDKELKRLLSDEFFALPESVYEVIQMEKLANRYLVKEQGLQRMWYTYDIYLSNDKYMKPSETAQPAEGVTVPLDGWKTFMAFRNSIIVESKEMKEKDSKGKMKTVSVGHKLKRDGLNLMLMTLCHESFHMQQYRYMASTLLTKDQRLCEATAIILERQFMEWLKSEKLLKAGSDIEETLTKTEGKFHWFSWTLERPIPTSATSAKDALMMIKSFLGLDDPQNTEMGYMLGEFLQYLLDKHKDKKVTLLKIFENYRKSDGLGGMLRNVFELDENSFYNDFQNFCEKHMKTMVKDQTDVGNEALTAGYLSDKKKISHENGYHRITNIAMDKKTQEAWGNAMRIFTFEPDVNKGTNVDMRKKRYNVYLFPSPAVNKTALKTVVITDSLKYSRPNPNFGELNKDRNPKNPVPAHVALLYRPEISKETIDGNWWVDVLALFEPENRVTTQYDNGTEALLVYPNVKPSQTMIDAGFLTGMQIVLKNNKTGKKKLYEISVNDWHKYEVVLCEELGIDPHEGIDVSLASRWYYQDINGTRYYGPGTEVTEYTQKGTGSGVNKKKETIIRFKMTEEAYFSMDYEDAEITGVPIVDIVISDNNFKIDIPTHTVTIKRKSSVLSLSMNSYTIKGELVEGQMRIKDVRKLEVTPIKYTVSKNYFDDSGKFSHGELRKCERYYKFGTDKYGTTDYSLANEDLEFSFPIAKSIVDTKLILGGGKETNNHEESTSFEFQIKGVVVKGN